MVLGSRPAEKHSEGVSEVTLRDVVSDNLESVISYYNIPL